MFGSKFDVIVYLATQIFHKGMEIVLTSKTFVVDFGHLRIAYAQASVRILTKSWLKSVKSCGVACCSSEHAILSYVVFSDNVPSVCHQQVVV